VTRVCVDLLTTVAGTGSDTGPDSGTLPPNFQMNLHTGSQAAAAEEKAGGACAGDEAGDAASYEEAYSHWDSLRVSGMASGVFATRHGVVDASLDSCNSEYCKIIAHSNMYDRKGIHM
jgi:hypothetical protein